MSQRNEKQNLLQMVKSTKVEQNNDFLFPATLYLLHCIELINHATIQNCIIPPVSRQKVFKSFPSPSGQHSTIKNGKGDYKPNGNGSTAI